MCSSAIVLAVILCFSLNDLRYAAEQSYVNMPPFSEEAMEKALTVHYICCCLCCRFAAEYILYSNVRSSSRYITEHLDYLSINC